MDIEGFLKANQGLSENTRRVYETTLVQLFHFMQKAAGTKKVPLSAEPTDEEVFNFLQPYKATSLHRHKAAIKAYFDYRKRIWPFGKRSFELRKQQVPRYVEVEKVHRLISTITDPDDRMAARTLFMLGIRSVELLGIEPVDVTSQGVLLRTTKGGDQMLQVCTADFLQELKTYSARRKGKVFPKKYQHYLNVIKQAGRKAGLKNVTPHMLRHARAVDLLLKKMPLAFVQQFLRHKDISTTAIYLQVTGSELTTQLDLAERANGAGSDIATNYSWTCPGCGAVISGTDKEKVSVEKNSHTKGCKANA